MDNNEFSYLNQFYYPCFEMPLNDSCTASLCSCCSTA